MWVEDAARDCGKSVKQVMVSFMGVLRRELGMRQELDGRWTILVEAWKMKRESDVSQS